MREWIGSLPTLLPIIGEFAGTVVSICNRKDHWDEATQKWVNVTTTIRNKLQFDFRHNKFGREIRVVHAMYKSINRAPAKEMPYDPKQLCYYKDFCLRTRDWKKRLNMKSEVIQTAEKLYNATEQTEQPVECLSISDWQKFPSIEMSKTDPRELYALREALQKVLRRYENDVFDYKLYRGDIVY